MSDQLPFGHDTLVIPFSGSMSPPRRGPTGGMSRMRSAGELFRNGTANAEADEPAPPKET